jgi:hypothetical protein
MSQNQLASQINYYNSNEGAEKYNDKLVRNNRIFVGIFFFFQIFFMFMYGFFARYASYVSESVSDVNALFTTFGVAALILLGTFSL